MPADSASLIQQMTLEEKAALCTGATPWQTLEVERLGLRHITVSDGPHGVRRSNDAASLIDASKPATCFPVAAALSATWDVDLLYELGQALGDECIALDVDVLLGPGINIKRSPLCGRNFEYFSEDPLIAGELSAALIRGVQSKGVGTSLKHFAVNNQEAARFTVSAEIDERTLHEIYLRGFEIAVEKAQPWTVMCAYNRVNGEYCSQHEYLLTKVLRDQWGYEGFVMSDWGAVRDRVAALRAGLELQMPGPVSASTGELIAAVQSGALDEAILDRAAERLLRIILRAQQTPKNVGAVDVDGHHALARRIASEAMVLLKNEDGLLPLTGDESLAVIGTAARKPSFQGGGSSHVNSTRVDVALDLLRAQTEVAYASGDGPVDTVDQTLIHEAVTIARSADVALLYLALPSVIESEGYDRRDLNLTPHQSALIQAVAAVQPRTVVILSSGSAVNMRPWIDDVPAVLETWLPGQAGAGAIMDVLLGVVNPSGKLAETFPLDIKDTPAYLNFPGENGTVRYGEGLHVGYRYYDALEKPVLFPFGYGLSYTTFSYSHLTLSPASAADHAIEVSCDVTNEGMRAGKEIVQLYVRDVASRLQRPPKELKAFAKIALEPGETRPVRFTLDRRAFAYYDPAYGQWLVEAGEFELLVGSSSADIRLRQSVTLAGTVLPSRLNANSTLGDWLDDPRGAALVRSIVDEFMAGDDTAETLGADKLAFFRDLPLVTLLTFERPSADVPPAKVVADLLAQV